MQKVKISNPQDVPDNRKGRIKRIKALPEKGKANFIPKTGAKLRIGPYLFKVCSRNVKAMKFSVELYDIVIEGVND